MYNLSVWNDGDFINGVNEFVHSNESTEFIADQTTPGEL
jgi:hypothetical protein